MGDLNSFATGDVNGDGATDIVTSRYTSSQGLYSGFEVLLRRVDVVACSGFEPPMDRISVTVKGKNRALPLKAQLFDADGYPVTDTDFATPPVVQVLFDPNAGGEPVDVTDDVLFAGHGTEGNQFIFTDEGKWQFNLKMKNYTAPGTYMIYMDTGDDLEYVIEPTCLATFVID